MSNPPNIVDVILSETATPQIVVQDVSPGPIRVDVVDLGTIGPQGQPGPPGPAGPAGPAMAWGGRAPLSTDGAAGASYIGTATAGLYGPKASDESMFPTMTATTGSFGSYELGVAFNVMAPGFITAFKFWRTSDDTCTTRTFRLWSQAGASPLVSLTTSAESGTGWKTFALPTPYAVTPGSYIVSHGATASSTPRITPSQFGNEAGNLRSCWGCYSATIGNKPNTLDVSNYLIDVVYRQSILTSVSVYPGNPVVAGDAPATCEAGIRFRALAAMKVTALRFWRSANATANTRTLSLWHGTTNALLATATTTGESGAGWMSATLATPYTLVAGQEYMVSFALASGPMPYSVGPAVPSTGPLLWRSGCINFTVGTVPTANVLANYYIADVVAEYDDPWPVVKLIRPAKMDAYTVPGNYTWTKPAGATMVRVVVQNPGSGGGSGCRQPTTANRSGGGGGGGGQRVESVFSAADLPATVAVVVAAGGVGALAITADNTNGSAGGAAGVCTFGPNGTSAWFNGPGNVGAGGGGGQSGAASTAGGGAVGAVPGGTGASGGPGGTGTHNFTMGATGGGGGGGLTSANAAQNGGAAFISPMTAGYGVTAGATGSATTGANGTSSTFLPTTPEPWPAGSGGSGGGAGAAGVGGNGGDGVRGGGGGGGGASSNGFNSGAGGKGGDGFVQVITYF